MPSLETLASLAKRRGFIFPSSEIYGGLSGAWDYGPLGVALKRNIERLWWRMFVESREDMYGVDAAILMNPRVWEASGHVAGFADPLVECTKCKKRFRADHVDGNACPDCGGKLGETKSFNMMFKTRAGASEDSSATVYLRPETAQGMFVNFKNILDTAHPSLPFGLGQIGKAFRNEINPRDFIFRTREFSQMEIEYFVRPEEWEKHFELWKEAMFAWTDALGLSRDHVSAKEIAPEDLAHYSKRTVDFEYEYPFGKGELYGLAYRTDFDLRVHAELSKQDLRYHDVQSNAKFLPHVIEPSFGLDRTVLAVLLEHYREDELGGETRVFLAFPKELAPVRVAVFPLLKNKPDLVAKARSVYDELRKTIPNVAWDDNGNIGKRYRRQDEIGTPFCVTIDFDTLENDTVTVRDRNTGKQERVATQLLVDSL